MVDNSPYNGAWGRPQDDGPAIRATALMAYAKHHVLAGKDAHFMDFLYKGELPANSVIKADLEYVSHVWAEESFDLWEEVKGLHFFTLMVQLRSLLEGATFAAENGDDGAARWYQSQAANITVTLDKFWNKQGWIVSTLSREKERTGLDCGVILGSLHGMTSLHNEYSPVSDRMLSTHYYYVQSMKKEYRLNQRSDIAGVALGRYAEDVYDGYSKSAGNPWYLCTAAAAEHMYTAIAMIDDSRAINVSDVSEVFYRQFLSTATAGDVYTAKSPEYVKVLKGMYHYGDTFMSVIQQFVQSNGSLSEQFNRNDGIPQGARDLTWSYGAFITASQARGRVPVF
jgi:glucoamylase